MRGAGDTVAMESVPLPSSRKIVLLHGIWNARTWVEPLALRLRRAGFEVDPFAYSGVFEGPEAAVARLREQLQASGPAALVGHSLGGLVALEALRDRPELPVDRVVCLGSPLCGSRAARGVAGHPWAAPALGGSRRLLQDGLPPWQGRARVGMVAGDRPHGLGQLFADLGEGSDGTVALDETRLPGLADHCIVHASHTALVFSAEAAVQVAAFLRRGAFLPMAGVEGGAGAIG